MMSVPCGRMTWRPWFLIAIFLLDFSCPASPQDEVIGRLYGADLVPTATFLCVPIPPRLPGSVNTHGVNVGYTITLLIILLTMAVDPTCDFDHRKIRPCKVSLTEDSECYFYCYCHQPLQPRYQILMLMFAVGVVEMLLLMAGDVERNPGPVVTELKPSDLVTVLTELLEAAAKWENIGLVLGLVSGTLDAIKAPHKSHDDCLRDMLKKWLNTSNPSWEDLIASLQSPLVGMNTLANRLAEKYCSQQASHSLPGSSDIRENRKRKLVTEDGNERQKQKLDPQTAIQDCAEMELESSDMPETRKRKLEAEGDSGTRKEICPADPAHTVTSQQGITAVTSVHSQDPIDKYASYLREYYLRFDFPDYDKLPTSPSKKYTRLASVLKKPVTKQEADEFTKKTIHGDIDDIAKEKTSISMEEIAPVVAGVWPKCILVEGAPGIGKTTFAWEMCRKWSKGEVLKEYQLVVLLRLRERKVRKAEHVSDLFHYYSKHVQQQVVQRIEETGGKGVLLLFEGYDELPANLRTKNSFFINVMKGDKLPMATVLVTSRPSASGFLYEKCKCCIKQHIEILGFTSADIQSYLKDTCGDNESLFNGLQKYLQCYPHIRTMMYVPLNAGIVVEVYRTSKVSNSVIPKTKTQLYQCLVCSLLRRYLSDHPVHGNKEWSIRSFEDLPEDVYEQFCKLARIADEGIRNNQQVIFNDLPEEFDTLGLMQCVPELYVDRGAAVSHSFPHLTIQEFMAAFHISQGPVQQWERRLNAHSDNERMVMRFVSGLTNLKGVVVCHQENYLAMIEWFHWIFEAQTDYPRSEGGNKEASVEYGSSSSFDWYVFGYCIAHSDRMWKIDAKYEDIGDEGVEGLVQGLREHESQFHGGISGLELKRNYITRNGIQHLSRLPKHMLSSLKMLSLANNPTIGTGVCTPLLVRLCAPLVELDLSNTGIRAEDCEALSKLPKHMLSSLRSLSLRDNPTISKGGCAPLVKKLPVTLVHLDLSNTGIGMEDCRALNKLLTSSSALGTLDISRNYLPPEVVELIFSGLQASTGVKRLELSMGCSHFSSQSFISLASVLQNNVNTGILTRLQLGLESSSSHQCEMTQGLQITGEVGNGPSTRADKELKGLMAHFKESSYRHSLHTLEFFQNLTLSTSIHGSVTHYQPDRIQGVTTLHYVLGYCVSHTTYTWDIELSGHEMEEEDFMPEEIGDAEVEEFVCGVLDCEAEPQSTITSLTIHRSKITSESIRQILRISKHMLSSLKSLELTESPGIDVAGYTVLNTLLESSASLETLDLRGNYLSSEAVAVVLSGLQKETALRGIKLFMTCSQFLSENCKVLASVLQNNNGTLKQLKLEGTPRLKLGSGEEPDGIMEHSERLRAHLEENLYDLPQLDLEFLQEPSTAIRGSVTQYQSDQIQGVSTWHYVLGYCVSHTNYTWEIQLRCDDRGYMFSSKEVGGIGDTEVEDFVCGLLNCEAQPQSTITSLTISHSKITSESIRQILKIPKHMFSSLKKLALTDSPGIDVACYTALNTLLESSSTLETLDLTGNNLPPESVAVVLSGLQKSNTLRGIELLMSCSQFSQQNCQSLASVLQNNNGTLRQMKLESTPRLRLESGKENLYEHPQLNLEFSQQPSTSLSGSVTWYQSERISTWHRVLGYCVSHTTYTWNIKLSSKKDYCSKTFKMEEIGDAEVEEFVHEVGDCEAQLQSTIASLTIHHSKITAESIRQMLKVPKPMLSSLKKLALTDSPGIDAACYTALNTLLESSSPLETLDLRGNNLPPESVAVVLNGVRIVNAGLQLFMTCSQFSLENCRLLASLLQHNTSILREIGISLYEDNQHKITLRILPGPLVAIQGSVRLSSNPLQFGSDGRAKFVPQPGCTTWDYVLGYCVSHTSHTWAIDLQEFGDEDVERFMQGILDSDSRNISGLSLSGKKLTSVGVNQLLKLPERISSLKVPSVVGGCMPVIKNYQEALTELHLGGSKIITSDFQFLSELLSSPSTLEIMTIKGPLPPEAVDLMLSGLQKNTGLKEFLMVCSQFSQENCKSLVTVVQKNSGGGGTLRRLQVAFKLMELKNSSKLIVAQRMELQFLPDPVTGVCGSVTRIIERFNVITSLHYALGYCVSHTACTWEIVINAINIHRNVFNAPRDEEVKAFVDGVLDCEYEQQSTITSLCLPGLDDRITSNGQTPLVTSAGIKGLLQLPKHMLCSLKTLSLNNNPKIGEEGCAPLVEMLPATLVHLNLSNAGIGVEDCRALNKLLTSSSALETLDVSGNYLPPEAVEQIFSGLQRATKPKIIKIDHSQLSPKAYELLSQFLTSHSLTLLSVSSCNIGPTETGQLVDALMCKDTLQCFNPMHPIAPV